MKLTKETVNELLTGNIRRLVNSTDKEQELFDIIADHSTPYELTYNYNIAKEWYNNRPAIKFAHNAENLGNGWIELSINERKIKYGSN